MDCLERLGSEPLGQPLTITYFRVRDVGSALETRDVLIDVSSSAGVLLDRQERIEDLAWDARQSDRSHQLGTALTIAVVLLAGLVIAGAIIQYRRDRRA